MAAWISTSRANTMTIDVTAVNDAPAGTDKTVTTLEDTAYTFAHGRLRLQRSERQAGQCAAGGQDHAPCRRRHADRQRRGGDGRPVRQPWPTSLPASWMFTPAANANGAGYASFTFQVQDNGGTANGGVDLDPVAEHDHHQRHRGERCAGGHRQHGHHAGGHARTPSRRPTSASAMPTTAGQRAAGGRRSRTLPARRHADATTASR